MDNENQVNSKTTPKLQLVPLKNPNIIEVQYSGSMIFTTKEEMSKLLNALKRKEEHIAEFDKRVAMYNEAYAQLKQENQNLISEKEKLIKDLKKANEEIAKRESVSKFSENIGQGRPPVLLDEHKRVVYALYLKGFGVADTYKQLVLTFGFKGNYETVRKFIKANRDNWPKPVIKPRVKGQGGADTP